MIELLCFRKTLHKRRTSTKTRLTGWRDVPLGGEGESWNVDSSVITQLRYGVSPVFSPFSMASNPATGISMTSNLRRESNLSGEQSAHHRSASGGENVALPEPHSPKVARRTSVRSNGSQPESRPDRSPERARAFSLGRLTFETGGLPRSLSTVQESGLSRAPTRRDTEEMGSTPSPNI